MKARLANISLALMLLVSVFAVVVSVVYIRKVNTFEYGIAQGYNIDGIYRDAKTGLSSLSFLDEDNKRWQFVDSGGNIVNGSFRATDDPNIYLLRDESGSEYGFIHLSYTSLDGKQGALYLHVEASAIAFDKMNDVPAFVVS